MHYDVPRYSQYLDVGNKFWRPRSCGIVALKILLDYWNSVKPLRVPLPTLPSLIRRAYVNGAYIKNVGWSHRGIAEIARQFGLFGKNFDWAKNTPGEALKKLMPHLRRGPIIASIYRDFRRKRGGHLVVVVRIAGNHVHLIDPASRNRGDISRSVPVSSFLLVWKRRIIVINPRRLRKSQ